MKPANSRGRHKTASRNVVVRGLILCLLLSALAFMRGQTGPKTPIATAAEPPPALEAAPSFATTAQITVRHVKLLEAADSDGAIGWRTEPPEALQHCEVTPTTLLFRGWQWPGHPQVVVLLIASDGQDIVTTRYVFPADGGEPPPEPPQDDLSVFVAELADGLDDKQVVAKFFANAIPRIWVKKEDPRELHGSAAIVLAVSTPIAKLDSGPWQEFSIKLFQHLLHEIKIGGDGPLWADAYRSVVKGLGGAK